ncbi:hypothetical protein QE197_14465 [Arsenophonus nasoniae]|uniref:Conserved hypothetical phage protein n=1 Tax=Arsenophonus nasoniae TaxID=638 RepID=D2U1I8_9GAMM|nr:hypothetical protein [Arsenophonus nasoniae]QBY44710.1 hypothetical protein ArsFIN_32960 [Arsenophonus nasoniae]WGM04938.1 hypothetical protein QE258_15310 [Arsenophonus nasoniae]WGM10036.1 hypothetical protein QE197_14465 [Arsenophonus nasoniae]WGM14752.1 hypothetical protein QE193_14380 [Arsenophonus nasoniae]CBA74629.1 conserved hypothetical phage protein [Arsenophonus nasoniae]
MGQVAFDTQEFVEKLENSGLNREQAKAITLVVRQSHEVSDFATKSDIKDVQHEIANVRHEIANVRKDMEHRFEKVETQIADVRKDMEHRFEKVELQILDVRKDISMVSKDLLFKLGGLIVTLFGIGIAIMKFL